METTYLNNKIVLCYTNSLDSKGAAALINKYMQCEGVFYVYKNHGSTISDSDIPISTTDYVKPVLIIIGVDVTNDTSLDTHIIPILRTKSLCAQVQNKDCDILMKHMKPVEPHNFKWIGFISKFYIREKLQQPDHEVRAFIESLLRYNTFLNNHRASPTWDALLDPGNSEIMNLLHESGSILLEDKYIMNQALAKEISVVNIRGFKCLIVNKRSADSDVFYLHPEHTDADFFIAYQDKLDNKQIIPISGIITISNCDIDEIHEFINRVYITTLFTVYRNNLNVDITDLLKHFGGKGTSNVGVFEKSVSRNTTDNNFTHIRLTSPGPTVCDNKYENNEVGILRKTTPILRHYGTDLLLVNTASKYTNNVISYSYDNDNIVDLLNTDNC